MCSEMTLAVVWSIRPFEAQPTWSYCHECSPLVVCSQAQPSLQSNCCVWALWCPPCIATLKRRSLKARTYCNGSKAARSIFWVWWGEERHQSMLLHYKVKYDEGRREMHQPVAASNTLNEGELFKFHFHALDRQDESRHKTAHSWYLQPKMSSPRAEIPVPKKAFTS